jgi:hypothetical protein
MNYLQKQIKTRLCICTKSFYLSTNLKCSVLSIKLLDLANHGNMFESTFYYSDTVLDELVPTFYSHADADSTWRVHYF